MKNLCLTVLAASAMLFSAQNLSAQEVEETVVQRAQDDYAKIEVQELPAEVQQAVERDFTGATIAEAYVKDHEGTQKFKLKVSTAEGEDKELYADAEGNWIEKEKKEEAEDDWKK
jgi:hypothetical protein